MNKIIDRITLFIGSLSLIACGFNINKKEAYISSYPKTNFNVGETFSSDGLSLIDISNGESINTFVTSIDEGYEFTTTDVGKKSVTISAEGYKALSYDITITDLPVLNLSGDYKTEYEYGEFFSLNGLVVTSNGNVITDYKCNFNVENKLTTPGTFTVIISKENYHSASYQITVKALKELSLLFLPNKRSYFTGEAFSLTGIDVRDEYNKPVSDYTCSIEEGTIFKFPGEDIEVYITKENYIGTSFTIDVIKKDVEYTKNRQLNIYYINDTHGSYARYENGYKSEAGMSYLGKTLRDAKNKDPENTLIISGGDMFEGGYESNTTKGQIMIDAMNSIGFDAMALGNHEFSWGEEIMENMINSLNCPVLSCNTYYNNRTTQPNYLKNYTVISKDDLKIGIIGSIREGIASSITGKVANDFYFASPYSLIQKYSRELRITHNCDVVLLATHDEGYETGGNNEPTKFKSVTEIDPQTGLKYVDGMLFAHDHYAKQGVYNDVPFLESKSNGMLLGKMTFNLSGSSVGYDVTSYSTTNINAYNSCTVKDSQIEEINTKYQDIIDEGSSIVTTFKVMHDKQSILNIILAAMIWYTNNNPDKFFNTYVYFASHNTGGVRVDSLEAGPLYMYDLIKAYPFENFMTIQTCKSNHISYMTNSSYYQTMINGKVTYDDNDRTYAVSINYISDSYTYGKYVQESYKTAAVTAQEALIKYLKAGVDKTL